MPTDLLELHSDARRERGYVIVLPGIEGRSKWNRSIARGLADAGLPDAIEIYDWTWRWPFFAINLRSHWLHARQAAILIDKIRDYQQAHPGRPVHLVGHSGGGALILETLAAMPTDMSITGAILLGPAMSPGYDLSAALRHVDGRVWSYHSAWDCVLLGALSSIGGAYDGPLGPCAGMKGFRCEQLPSELLPRLTQVPYDRAFAEHANRGGHFGYVSRTFVRERIAPLLREPVPQHATTPVA